MGNTKMGKTMRTYVQFLDIDLKKKLTEAMGTDGVMIVDGRKHLQHHICDAQIRMHRLRKIHSYVGYRIMKGERFDNSICTYEWIRSGTIFTNKEKETNNHGMFFKL